MIYKIENLTSFIPHNANYVKAVKEQNGTITVDYFANADSKHPVLIHNRDGMVLTTEQFLDLIGEEEGTDPFQNRDAGVVMTVVEVIPQKDVPSDEWEEVGDPFSVHDGADRGRFPRGTREGDIHQIASQDNQRVLVWVRVVSIDDGQEYLELESADPMKKLDDTTKVKGQADRKLRKGDKAGSQIKDNEYYSDGEDSKGPLRFPHSDAEKQFYDQHGELKVHDHPANTDKWHTTVTNKALNQKTNLPTMEGVEAPLSSNEYDFFLSEDVRQKPGIKLPTVANKIEEELMKPINNVGKNLDTGRREELQQAEMYAKTSHSAGYIEYHLPRDLVGEGIYLRNWLLRGGDHWLEKEANNVNNQDIASILRYLRDKGFRQEFVRGLEQQLNFGGGADAGGGLKLYTHVNPNLEDDDLYGVVFKLKGANHGEFAGYSLGIHLFSFAEARSTGMLQVVNGDNWIAGPNAE